MSPRTPRHEPDELRDSDSSAFSDARPPGRGRAPKSQGSVLPWVLLVMVLVGCGLAVVTVMLPLRDELHAADEQLQQARAASATLQDHVGQLEAAKTQLEQARDSLARELEGKEQDLQAVQAAQEELVHTLQGEMASGDVSIRESRGELVVDLVDTILFDSGEATLNGKGKTLLRRVADAMVKVSGKIIEVRGHTDAVPIAGKLRSRFASNWELSTQRATNVVRFLQEDCAVPGERLVAAGFSQYHPTAANTSKLGRARNRRIEVVLLPRLQGG